MIDTNALRKKVLDLAIRGKLVPHNPNDEPASILLERIREEKQRLIREGKIKKDKVDSVIFRGDDNCHYEKIGNNEPVLFEDFPFEIPTSWCWVRFSSLIKVISGVSYDKHDICNKGIRILRGGNINNFNVSLEDDDVFLPDSYYDEEKQVQINDILIVASTGSKLAIGKAGYVITNLENTQIGAFLRIVRPLFEEFSEYIKTIFATNYYKEHILDSIRGSNINNLKNEHISNLLIPVPPMEEQLRIAKYIKELFAQIDLIEKNQSDYNSLVESLKKAILQSAIQGTLVDQDETDEPASVLLEKIRAEKKAQLGKKYVESYIYKSDDNRYYEKNGSEIQEITEEIPFDIPQSWEWCRASNCLLPMESQKPQGVSFQYIDIDAIDNKKQIVKMPKIVETSKAPSRASRKVHAGDTLFSMVRPYLKNIAFIDEALKNCIASTGFYVCQPDKMLYSRYLFLMLISPYFIDGVMEFMKGDNSPSIRTENLENMLMPIPPLREQERIVNVYNSIISYIKDED